MSRLFAWLWAWVALRPDWLAYLDEEPGPDSKPCVTTKRGQP